MERNIAQSHENHITPTELEAALASGIIVKCHVRYFKFDRQNGLLFADSINGPWKRCDAGFGEINRPTLSLDDSVKLERILNNK